MSNWLAHKTICKSKPQLLAITYRPDGVISNEVTEYLFVCQECGHTWKKSLNGKPYIREKE